jgi:hypothetical protein
MVSCVGGFLLFGILLSGSTFLLAVDYTLLATPTTVECGHYAMATSGNPNALHHDGIQPDLREATEHALLDMIDFLG